MSYLEMIFKQSPWLKDAALISEDIHLSRLRDFPLVYHEQAFLSHHFEDGVYIVTGPRQIGKSTHLKLLIQQKINSTNHTQFLYFNCDLLDRKQDIVDLVEEYLLAFPSKERRYIFLDEITAVKDSFLAIKFLVDSGRLRHLTYILTGSNTISIKKTGEYLPGRRDKGIDFHFKPLSFATFIELLYPQQKILLDIDTVTEKDWLDLKESLDLNALLTKYMMTGGFPRVINEYYLNQHISSDIFTIYRSWITSEIAKADKKEYIAKGILERSLISLGSDISYNAFSQDSGIGSHNTVYDYIDFFVNAYVLSQIFNYDIDQKRVQYRKNKKIYFNDPFIYAVVEAWLSGKPEQDFDYLDIPEKKSRLVENLVYLKLTEMFKDVYFHKEQSEIDFVAGKYIFEVKYQNKIIPEDYRNLLKHPLVRLVISKNRFKKTTEISILPLELFLLCRQ